MCNCKQNQPRDIRPVPRLRDQRAGPDPPGRSAQDQPVRFGRSSAGFYEPARRVRLGDELPPERGRAARAKREPNRRVRVQRIRIDTRADVHAHARHGGRAEREHGEDTRG